MKTNRQFAYLRYNGIVFRRYAISDDGQLFRQMKFGKWKRQNLHPRGNGYVGFNVSHPKTGNRTWVMLHKAVLESFTPPKGESTIAGHGPNTSRRDGALGTCNWTTPKGNREDRRRDETYSTGHRTIPNKLAFLVDEIVSKYDKGYTQKELAEEYLCSRQAIRYHLNKHGRL